VNPSSLDPDLATNSALGPRLCSARPHSFTGAVSTFSSSERSGVFHFCDTRRPHPRSLGIISHVSTSSTPSSSIAPRARHEKLQRSSASLAHSSRSSGRWIRFLHSLLLASTSPTRACRVSSSRLRRRAACASFHCWLVRLIGYLFVDDPGSWSLPSSPPLLFSRFDAPQWHTCTQGLHSFFLYCPAEYASSLLFHLSPFRLHARRPSLVSSCARDDPPTPTDDRCVSALMRRPLADALDDSTLSTPFRFRFTCHALHYRRWTDVSSFVSLSLSYVVCVMFLCVCVVLLCVFS